MLLELLLVHKGELGRAGHEHRQDILLRAGRVLPVVLDDALDGHIVEKLLDTRLGQAGGAHELGQRHGDADLHVRGERRLLLGHDGGEAPVVGVGRLGLVADAVRDLVRLAQDARFQQLARRGARLVTVVVHPRGEGVDLAHVLLREDTVRLTGGVRGRDDVAGGDLLVRERAAHRVVVRVDGHGPLLYVPAARPPSGARLPSMSLAYSDG